MDKPRVYVDFNEMLEPDLFLLSKDDLTVDSAGNEIALREGQSISVYSDDLNDQGKKDHLIAEGVVERNTTRMKWAAAVKWCCRIGKAGIQHESDIR